MTGDGLDGGQPHGEAIEERLGSHVAEVMSAARQAAEALQADVERAALARSAEIETVAARRAHEVRMAAEADAERLYVQTRAATQQYVAASRRLVDEFAKERMRRIAEIGDRLGEQAAALADRLQRSDDLARHVDALRVELAAACERIADEARMGSPELARLADPPSLSGEAPPPATAASSVVSVGPATPQQRLARATGRMVHDDAAALDGQSRGQDDDDGA